MRPEAFAERIIDAGAMADETNTGRVFGPGSIAIFRKLKSRLLAAAALVAVVAFFYPSNALAIQATLLDDAYTSSSKTTSKFGSVATIIVSPTTTGFVQFDLSTLPAGTDPADIRKATLTLYVTAASVKVAGSVSVKVVSGSWDELNITHVTKPPLGATIATVPVAVTDASQFISIDITNLVKDWVGGVTPNRGVALVGVGTTTVSFDAARPAITLSWK
jgi:hypothetical protein